MIGQSAVAQASMSPPSLNHEDLPADDVDATLLEQAQSEASHLESELFGGNPENAFDDPVREKTVVLDMGSEMQPEVDGDATVNLSSDSNDVDPMRAELEKLAKEEDPIDSALAGFEQVSSSDFAPEADAPAASAGAEVKELSQEDFADVFASGPIQVSQVKSAVEARGKSRAQWLKIAGLGSAGAAIAAGIAVFVLSIQSESGLMGYRLEGFSLVKAYQPPSPEVQAQYQLRFDAAKKAMDRDDPVQLEASLQELKKIANEDVRNLEALSWIMLCSARLQEWEGSASTLAKDFDEANAKYSSIRSKLQDGEFDSLRELAVIARQLAIGDFKNLDSQFDALAKKLPENAMLKDLRARSLFLMGRTDEAKAQTEKLSSMSRALQFLRAKANQDEGSLQKLAADSYLPAQVLVDLNKLSVEGAEQEASLKKLDELYTKVKRYPRLSAMVKEKRGDLLAQKGDEAGARQDWEESLKTQASNVTLILKLVDSFEREGVWDRAIESLQNAARVSNGDRGISLRLARLLRDRMKIVESLDVLEKLIVKHPKDSELLHEKGLAQLKVFQEEPAKLSFQAAIEIDAKFEPAIISLAAIATRQQDWQEAERLYKQIPESSSQYSFALLGLGNMALSRYKLDEAQKYFALAIKNNPKTESAYDGLVRLLLRKEEDAKAGGIVSEGEKALPTSPIIAVARSRILAFQGQYQEALAKLEPFRSRMENDLEFQFARIDILLDAKRFDEAGRQLEVLSKQEIVDPEFHFLKAKILLLEPVESGGNREAASRAISSALRTRPETEKYLLLKAKIDTEVDDRKESFETINKLLTLYPDNAQAYLVRGDLYFEEGNYAQAIDSYSKALQFTRFVGETFRKLAVLYKATSQAKKAIEYFSKVVQASPLDAEAHLELGKLYVETTRPLKAVEHFKKASELNPKLSEAHYHLGYILKDMGQSKAAVREFEKYLSRNPDSVEAATVRDEIFFLKQQLQAN